MTVHVGCCRDVLGVLFDDDHFDAVVTDPPYGLSRAPNAEEVLRHWLAHDDYRHDGGGFMGHSWDSFVPGPAIWREVFRVLKPGGHALVFAGTRTVDLMGIALRLAGFEIRDSVAWIYGTGFPKSAKIEGAPGWGSGLKPAFEPVIVARKPLAGTLSQNFARFGVGGLNVEACRVPLADAADAATFAENHAVTERLPADRAGTDLGLHAGGWKQRVGAAVVPPGRFPANLIHDGSDEVVAAFPEAPGALSAVKGTEPGAHGFTGAVGLGGGFAGRKAETVPRGDKGSAARFFYSAKASKADRGPGNVHPTVKPTELMRYLCRLVTPPGGLVLDPFTGSGSTGKAAILEGFDFVGIERSPEYAETARARIDAAKVSKQAGRAEK